MNQDCAVDGCDKPARSRKQDSKCRMHGMRIYRGSEVGPAGPLRKRGPYVSYGGAHQRVSVARGKASEHACVSCPNPAVEWAYQHDDPCELVASVRGRDGVVREVKYSDSPEHYKPMCDRCHRKFDHPTNN